MEVAGSKVRLHIGSNFWASLSRGDWLPLLALFTGARQAEIAGLQASNVQHETDNPMLFIVADRKAGKRLK
jgi:hypothetical protein